MPAISAAVAGRILSAWGTWVDIGGSAAFCIAMRNWNGTRNARQNSLHLLVHSDCNITVTNASYHAQMNVATPDSTAPGPERSARFHRWRGRKDKIARWLIGAGGVATIFAIVLLFFYLLKVVLPLFTPASTSLEWLGSRPNWARSEPLYLAIEEQKEIGIRILANGDIEFFRVHGAETISTTAVVPGAEVRVVRVAEAAEHTGLLAVATADGRVFLLRLAYATNFDASGGNRQIVPSISFPYGQDPQLVLEHGEIRALSLSDSQSPDSIPRH